MIKSKIALAVDLVVIYENKDEFEVLLIKRKKNPFKNKWAFPGGFVEEKEPIIDAAKRELWEETSLKVKKSKINFLGIFDDPKRDPRGRVISIAYLILLKNKKKVKANSDAKEARWFSLNEIPKLAFDHKKILEKALKKLNER